MMCCVQPCCLLKKPQQARTHIYVDCTVQWLAYAQWVHQRPLTIVLALQVKLPLHVFDFALYPSKTCATLPPCMSMFLQSCE